MGGFKFIKPLERNPIVLSLEMFGQSCYVIIASALEQLQVIDHLIRGHFIVSSDILCVHIIQGLDNLCWP